MSLTSQQQDALIALARQKGYRTRGKGSFVDWLGVGDAMSLGTLSDASYAEAMRYLAARPDAPRRTWTEEDVQREMQRLTGEVIRPAVGADDIGESRCDMSNPFEMKANNGAGGDFDPCPAGTYPAVLLGLLDIGTYAESYMGGPPADKRKVLLVWEAHVDDKRYYVGRDYTLSFNTKAELRKLVEKWRGKTFGNDEPFDLTAVVGKPCLLSIIHKESAAGNNYARVDGVMQLPKGMPAPVAAHKPVVWSVTTEGPPPAAEWIPYLRGKPLKDVVSTCKERSGGRSAPLAAEPERAPAAQPANAVPF